MKYLRTAFFLLAIFSLSALNGQSAYYGKINKYSNLYRMSSNHSPILAWLSAKTTVFVVSDVVVNGFLHVIYPESGIEGYINQTAIDFTDKALDYASADTFAQPLYEQTDTVVIKVTNNTSRTLTLKIDNRNYTIVSNAQQRITVAAGKRRYIVFGPKFLPVVGIEVLTGRQNYSWKISAMGL
ncbi:MAG: hypothetical protein LBS01_09600 [Prevotellaceae bacterium]|jgi:hypothetical protein|nr:hypothetical protein [Prevotellaceae bacterium]